METNYNIGLLCLVTHTNEHDSSAQVIDTIPKDTERCDTVVTETASCNNMATTHDSSVGIVCWSVLVALAILVFVLFIYLRNFANKYFLEFRKMKEELVEYKTRLQEIKNNHEEIMKKLNDVKTLETPTTSSPSINKQTPTSNVSDESISKHVITIVKYADFYMEENMPIVENRDLSDDNQAGAFKIMIKENDSTATYTINHAKINSIMQDVAVIADYVENLQGVPNAKSIEAVENGILLKIGNKWKIETKMKVRLV